jgi:hypothetical protein
MSIFIFCLHRRCEEQVGEELMGKEVDCAKEEGILE